MTQFINQPSEPLPANICFCTGECRDYPPFKCPGTRDSWTEEERAQYEARIASRPRPWLDIINNPYNPD